MAVAVQHGPPSAVEEARPEPIVEARSVRKVYETGKVQVHARQGVDLGLERGEMVAIMGPSGYLALIFFVVHAIALAATLVPALKASRTRPAEALRYQ